ncbi:MAG TPA: DUF58 domain-containing protein [Catalimonadaceae bacterium]|nr:DUF58 domain-containing protein [Catalimonadaceae bacterium]
MELREIIQKLRNYEIKIRKAINTQMQGDYHSVFKGFGLEFDDVREYQYGDDVRSIDWNVSAKGHGTFVKTFKEEKEQTIFFLLDVSASQEVGKYGMKKLDMCKEICGVLSLSAVKEGSQVGVIAYSNVREKYIKPGKGMQHAYRVIAELYGLKTQSTQTDLNAGIYFTMNMVKRKSIIIVLSDFIDRNYEQALQTLSRRHDVVVIHLMDNREKEFPKLGIVPLFDPEKRKTYWVNTSLPGFTSSIRQQFQQNQNHLEETCRKQRTNYLAIRTTDDYVSALIRLFKIRNGK